MNRNFNLIRAGMLAAIVAAAVTPVYAQVYVQNGNAQDANNLVGSGGSNTPVQGFVPSNPNIYGLQNSGAAFNPAGMPQFSRVVPVPIPGGGTTYAQIPVVGQSSFQSSGVSPSQVRLSSVSAVSQGVSSLAVGRALNGAVNTNQSYSAQIGAGLGVSSALTGIGAVNQVNAPLNANGQYTSYFNNNVSLPTNPQAYSGISTGSSGQINPLFGLRPMSGALMPTGNQSSKSRYLNRGESSFKINGKVSGSRSLGLASVRPTNSAIGKPNQGMVGYVPRKHVPSGDYYQRLLTELSTGRRSKIVAPGIGGASAITNTTLAPVNSKKAQQLMIDPITGLPIAPITAKRTVGQTSTGGVAPNGSSNVPHAVSPTGSQNWLTPKTQKMLRAGRHVPAISQLAGRTHSTFNRFMKRGQMDLKQGRYIAALYRFNSALIVNPGNQLARLARANTELMGGMYASAYADFKTVFAHHPRFTALRYNWNAMLPRHAVEKTQTQLKRMLPDQSDAAAFLLAYTYYQTGHDNNLRQLLSLWASWGTGSLWPSILNRAWLINPAKR